MFFRGMLPHDRSRHPLALSGPGAISTVIVLTQQIRGKGVEHFVVLPGIILITCTVSYVMLRHASRVTDILGQTGLRILTRLMGLLLAVIAVQFILNGFEKAMSSMIKTWLSATTASVS